MKPMCHFPGPFGWFTGKNTLDFSIKHLLYLFSWPVRWHQQRSCSSLWWCRVGSWSDWRRSQPGWRPRPPPIKHRPTLTDLQLKLQTQPLSTSWTLTALYVRLKVSGRLMCLWYQWSMSLAAKQWESGKSEIPWSLKGNKSWMCFSAACLQGILEAFLGLDVRWRAKNPFHVVHSCNVAVWMCCDGVFGVDWCACEVFYLLWAAQNVSFWTNDTQSQNPLLLL